VARRDRADGVTPVADLYTPFSEWMARRIMPLAVGVGRLLWDLEVTGREQIPDGPVVFAGNHQSHVDPPLLSIAVRRNVRYLAVDELFGRAAWFDGLMLFFGAIPTPRGRPPLRALRTAIDHLESGGLVGVFPEGRRTVHWGENGAKRGAAWLALRTGAPLVPVAIAGAERTLGRDHPRFVRTPIRVWIEGPLDPSDYLDRVDPIGGMMDDWRQVMDRRLEGWTPTGGPADRPDGVGRPHPSF
jgi:1-acyl-sn-glycerol-3-phosphate acyltransferase